jgi:hypothetical protein
MLKTTYSESGVLYRMVDKKYGGPSKETILCEVGESGITPITKQKNCYSVTDIGSNKNTIMIFIKMLTGKTITIFINQTKQIGDIKVELWNKERIPITIQQLIFNKKQILDNEFIDKCGITNESTIHLITRLRGGMMHETSSRNDFELLCNRTNIITGRVISNDIPIQKLFQELSLCEFLKDILSLGGTHINHLLSLSHGDLIKIGMKETQIKSLFNRIHKNKN